MNWIENLLIIGGVSLDIFATMECEGSVVAKIDKKKLAEISILTVVFQMAVLYLGSLGSGRLMRQEGVAENEILLSNVIAAIIFAGLGVHLIIKAVRNERIYEHRQDTFSWKKILLGIVGTGIYTLLAGFAFGLMGIRMRACILLLGICSLLMVVAGVYTGYRFGFEQKKKAYGIGAVLLWAAGIDVLIQYVLTRI